MNVIYMSHLFGLLIYTAVDSTKQSECGGGTQQLPNFSVSKKHHNWTVFVEFYTVHVPVWTTYSYVDLHCIASEKFGVRPEPQSRDP